MVYNQILVGIEEPQISFFFVYVVGLGHTALISAEAMAVSHKAAIVQFGANNGPVQHPECVSVPSPLTMSYYSDEVESLLVLCLQHTDVLLKGKLRVPPQELYWHLH